MSAYNIRHFLFVGLISAVVAGCAADLQPYIYQAGEFDRTRRDFNQPIKDRSELIICYNKYKTTPKKIREMAVLECAKFNKKAVYTKQEVRICPLATPVSVYYQCVGPGNQETTAAGTAK